MKIVASLVLIAALTGCCTTGAKPKEEQLERLYFKEPRVGLPD